MSAPIESAPIESAPAGFWRRYAAWSLDATLLALPTALLCAGPTRRAAHDAALALQRLLDAQVQALAKSARDGLPVTAALLELLHDPALRAAAAALQTALLVLAAWPLLIFAALGALWHVGFEASRRQASPGKRLLGLRVQRDDGAAPGSMRALLRYGAGALSWLTLNLGHAMALVPPAHCALHDRLSATRVVCNARTAMPPWARAWILVQGLAGLALAFAAVAWLASVFQAALERGLT